MHFHHLATTASLALLLAGTLAVAPQIVLAPAFAQQSQDSGGKGPQAGKGSGGHEDETHEDGGHEDGGHEGGSGHEPIGGTRAGQSEGGQGSGGGKPVWSREGIPEVELGRLNVARSPEQVLDRALEEAKSSFTAEVAQFYRQDLDAMIASLSLNWDNVQFIDSPLQNLALLEDALDGTSVLREVGIITDVHTLQAAFLGTASDKTITITPQTALAVATILGSPVSLAEAEALARDAERIRIAILAGHG